MDLGPVDHITADAVGEPGDRTFYIQARAGKEVVTVIVEKQQVQLLAASVLELLEDAPATEPIANETMEPLAEARRLDVRTSDALIEMDAGAWTGRTLPSLRRTKLWETVQLNPSRFSFPGGESFVDAEARALDEIERIVAPHPRGRVAVGTHGDLVGMLISHYTGAHLDQFQRVTAEPASVSVVHLGAGAPRILLVNDTGSLRRFAAPKPDATKGQGATKRDGRKRKLRG